ncbi:hypothetical protein AQUSIP_08520 [Aquicella siphonis]|uniref:Uncharacterized protein n=1 Tax=Aquicella siphonis TaxID=254247 RepID=A0A5E4PGG4_9COXI|nr:hypothetical protein [Aquicella siphonis]VVC75562.1 hypothetical protein AQUSIP_08520 [Aquicella siphonis]
MKTIIIDWDHCAISNDDLKKLIEKTIFPDVNVVIASSCVSSDIIKNRLNDLCPGHANTIQDIVILQPETFMAQSESKKNIGHNKLDLMDDYMPQDADYNDYLFISNNLFARQKITQADIPVGSKLPEYKIRMAKDPDRPVQQHWQNFSFETSQTLFPSTGNRFGGKVSVVDKTRSDKTSSWYAKEKPAEKINFVQIEVFTGELLRFLLGETLPKTRYLTRDDNLFVLSKRIEGFTNLNSVEALETLKENNYKGLLPLLFACMFVEEADLKPDNIGIDAKGNITKIDNDGTFTSITFSMSGANVPTYSALRQNLVEQFGFSKEDIDSPHAPEHYSPPLWPKTLFTDSAVISKENQEDMYYLWAKILSASNVILQIMSKTIDSAPLKATLEAVLTAKMEKLNTYMKDHPGFIEFMSNNGERVMNRIREEIAEFAKSNRRYFAGANASLLKPVEFFQGNSLDYRKSD